MKTQTQTYIYGVKAQGGKELIKHLKGERLTRRQIILGKCYDCLGGYVDGKKDCEIPSCTLYPLMPYREKEK